MTYYIALVHKDPDSSFGLSFPDVRRCYSVADTLEELAVNESEALSLLAEAGDDDFDLPAPRSIDSLRLDPDFQDAAREALVLLVPAPAAPRSRGRAA
jgi:predicted RNase H-like HicB family nuclease